jgi:restriction system protein
MPVPDFQSMMLPFLQFAADGKEHELGEVAEHIAAHFKLTAVERDEPLPSGNQTRLLNRVGWCRTHLKNAGLVEYIQRGVFRITERGQQLLAKKPKALSLKLLDEIPEHKAWFHQKKTDSEPVILQSGEATPEEQMEALAADLKQKLASELLERVKAMKPFRFERLVLNLLIKMGYGGARSEAAEAGKGVNDGGIDGLINEDRLGLDRIYVQAKCWDASTVGRPQVQAFVGALTGQQAQKGIFITTSDFSSGALEYVKNLPQRVILIDGQRLAELMVEHDIGVSLAYAYELKRIDSDYFEEG